MKGFQRKRERGMTLIEVMVALLVLGIGVMGYAALQLRSVKLAEDTYSRSQAMAIAQDAIERIRANVDALPAYLATDWTASLNTPSQRCVFTGAVPAAGCSSAEMVVNDVYEVRSAAATMLASGNVSVAACSPLTCVTVAWADTVPASCDQSHVEAGDRGSNAHCVVVEFIP